MGKRGHRTEKKRAAGDLTEIVFLLDRSGSMAGLEADTVGGFNAMIARQNKEAGRAVISTVLFDDACEVIHDRVDLRRVEKLTEEQYSVRGCTALLDALGGAVEHIGLIHKYARAEDRPAKTIFVVTTDGMENASRRYTADRVKGLVERQQEKYGWEFLFLGANMDAIAAAGRCGIRADRAVRYECDGAGTALNFAAVSAAVGVLREGRALRTNWKASIEEDYRKRGKR